MAAKKGHKPFTRWAYFVDALIDARVVKESERHDLAVVGKRHVVTVTVHSAKETRVIHLDPSGDIDDGS